MADKKISALSAASTPLAGTEVLPIVQSSTTDQVSVANLTAGRAVSGLSFAAGSATSAQTFSATGIASSGSDTNIDINLTPKGTGAIKAVSASANGPDLHIGGVNTGNIYLGDTVAYQGALKYSAAGNTALYLDNTYDAATAAIYIRTRTAGTPVNNLLLKGDGTVTTVDNIIQGTAAKGINFTANTPAAGMTSQLLNWYEEGTWTPTIGFSTSNGDLSYSVQVGTYTKIGNICVVQATLTFSETTASGNLRITNLPFTASNQTNITQGFGCYVDGMTGLSGAPVATITNNSTTMNFFYTGTGATSAITNSNTAAGSVIRFSASYRTL